MTDKFKLLILTVSIMCLSFNAEGSQEPPEPDGEAPICDSYDYDPDTLRPPPPPGLPCVTLPIDDYIIPLLLMGLAFGAFKMNKLKSV